MDPLTLALISAGIGAASEGFSAYTNWADSQKDRKQRLDQLTKAYQLQNESLNRQISLAKKNRYLTNMEGMDELVNFAFANAANDYSQAEQTVAQTYR